MLDASPVVPTPGGLDYFTDYDLETLRLAVVAQVSYWVALGDGTTLADQYDELGFTGESLQLGQVNIPMVHKLAPARHASPQSPRPVRPHPTVCRIVGNRGTAFIRRASSSGARRAARHHLHG